jgi:Predicted transcriptional regulator
MNSPAANPRWIHSVKCELAEEVLRTWGTLRLQVNGWSMLPSIWPGDTLLIESVDHHGISAGDIVLFQRLGQMVVHRVVEKAERTELPYILTRGDSMPQMDPPVPNLGLLGKVQYVVRNGRRLTPARSLNFLERIIAGMVQRWNIAAWAVIVLRTRLQTSPSSFL